MLLLTKIKFIVIHHSQNDNHTLDLIRNLHVEKNGWEDVGYHYLIDNNGDILNGRSIEFQGAHVLGHNENSIGICLIGNLDNHSPTEKQMQTLEKFILELIQKYNLSSENILGHREFEGVTKTCPGKFIDMKSLREIF